VHNILGSPWAAMALVVGALLGSGPALADTDYPDKAIRWIVPLPPGGGVDFSTRVVANELSKRLGQPIVIENRPGASGTIGVQAVVRSAPDGYTLLTGNPDMLISGPLMLGTENFDAQKDLSPIGLMARVPFFLVVNPGKLPVSSLAELVEYAKKNPDRLSYASFGAGTINHLLMELLKQHFDMDILHVPYKGAAPAVQGLMGGEVDLMFVGFGQVRSNMGGDRMRPLAVSTHDRHPLLPDLPALRELGITGFDMADSLGVLVPAGTPPAIVQRLNQELKAVVESPEVAKAYGDVGTIPVSSTPAEFAAVLQESADAWAEIVTELKQEEQR